MYVITGIPTSGAEKELRLEINGWFDDAKNLTQVSLFLQALSFFQSQPVTEQLSYFQIAGIHGEPLVPWDEKTQPQTPNAGYCTHNSVLFPSWHRPYLALYEQRIHEIMVNTIIPKFPAPRKDELLKAANSWRLPFWDWAISPAIPKICLSKSIQVDLPTGPGPIDNSCYFFHMPGPSPKPMRTAGVEDRTFGQCTATSRWPRGNVSSWANGQENNDQANQALNRHSWNFRGSLKDAVYRLFSTQIDYETFSTTALMTSDPGPRDYLNLEYIHNNIHGWTGGNGQMGVPSVAAFDPVFWFHHCNIDRQYAIWQSLYRDTWFEGSGLEDSEGTWSIPQGSNDTTQTGLAPFHKDANGNYFTSDDIRDWQRFGYSYTELQPWTPKYNTSGTFNYNLYRADLTKAINDLYGVVAVATRNADQSAPATVRLVNRSVTQQVLPEISAFAEPSKAKADAAEADQKTSFNFSTIPLPVDVQKDVISKVDQPEQKVDIKHPDYIVNVKYKKFELDGEPYDVRIYIGEYDENAPTHDDLHSAFVGDVYNFSSPLISTDAPSCENCKKQKKAEVLSTGQVPVTIALIGHIEDQGKNLWSLQPDDVERYLRINLRWRVVKNDGEAVPLDQFPSLTVSLAVGRVTHFAQDDRLASYDDYNVLPGVTDGRQCGLQAGQSL